MTRLLQDLPAGQAEQRPDETALVMGDESLTYGELETLSNRLANLLRDGRSRRGNRVCLFLPKSPLAITSMLAVLKADGAYVPIDIASPAPRVARIWAPAVGSLAEEDPAVGVAHGPVALHAWGEGFEVMTAASP